ncbi:LPXTG cell wall anchor domain-containing protein [Streptomyces sp. NPDC015346]|uniref:LPXTG cell wall anchor domain-containing protein n=1 Tax=Streptomyces sp. NPDC015346 TaxID=3364954 RepID=UPI0036FD688F
MRRSLISAGTLVAAMATSLLLAPTASASGNPKGDNGTVKIHDSKTGEELRKNEPKVCSFYLDAFKFDAGQKVVWQIQAWSNNDKPKGTEVNSGAITLDEDGHVRTEDMTLPDGQYKLFWDFEGKKGDPKKKVFWVDCEPGKNDPPKPGETPDTGTPGTETPGTETPGTETPGTGTPTTPGETPGASESPAPNAPGEQGGSGGDDAKGDSEGNLAETGSSAPVGAMAAVAVALAGAGAFLVMRRRKTQQQSASQG